MRISQIVVIISVLVLLTSCNKKEHDVSEDKRVKEAIKKNDAAVKLLQEYRVYSGDQKDLNNAMDSINMAIQLDSTYARAFWNKSLIFAEKKKFQEAIESLEMVRKLKSRNNNSILTQGFYYLKMGDTVKAKGKYQEALQHCNKYLTNNPNDLEMKRQRAFVYTFTHSQEKALAEINQIINNYPDDKIAQSVKHSIKNVNNDFIIED